MKRLTENYKGKKYLMVRTPVEGEYTDYDRINDLDNCIQKLGRIEDREEELGIPLEVLFKALKDGAWAKHPYQEQKEINHYKICSFEWYIDKWVIWFSIRNEKDFLKAVKDYGKTWAFTKEELQDAIQSNK